MRGRLRRLSAVLSEASPTLTPRRYLCSMSRPVASSPQRVTSATRSEASRRRLKATRAMGWKNSAAAGGAPPRDEPVRAVAVQAVDHAVDLGLARGGPVWLVAEHAHLAEDLARTEPRQNLLDAPGHRLGDHDAAVLDE